MQYSTTEGTQGICPTGWHIPASAEFQTLNTTVSGDGNALKEIGQGTGAGAGTNTSGFSALLAGYNSGFLGEYSFFWSSKEEINTLIYFLQLNSHGSLIFIFPGLAKNSATSVRCIKD